MVERPRQVQPAQHRDDDVLRRGTEHWEARSSRWHERRSASRQPARAPMRMPCAGITPPGTHTIERDGEIHRRARVLHPHRVRTEAAHGSRERLRPADDEDHERMRGRRRQHGARSHDVLDETRARIHDGDRTGNTGILAGAASPRSSPRCLSPSIVKLTGASRALRRGQSRRVTSAETFSVASYVTRTFGRPSRNSPESSRRRSILALLEDRIAAQERIRTRPDPGQASCDRSGWIAAASADSTNNHRTKGSNPWQSSWRWRSWRNG